MSESLAPPETPSDYKKHLRLAHYPLIDLYLTHGHQKQRSRDRTIPPVIKFAETKDVLLAVHAEDRLSTPQTMALIWGALGFTIEDLAEDMYVSHSSSKGYRLGMFRQLGAKTMSHAVGISFREGVLANGQGKAKELSLTPRNLDLLQGASEGLKKKEVGDRLSIGGDTARTYGYYALQKNGLLNTTHAVTMAFLSEQLPLEASRQECSA